jgi:TRAP-type mannitol/chloroaromatic compound transport system permease small subunit
MTQPSPGYLAVIRRIDSFIEWTGYLVAFLCVPLIAPNVWEVVSRYALNDPTDWAQEITTMSYGAMFMLGAAYALLKGAHVRTDMLWERFSDRTKGQIDTVAYVVFFFPAIAVLFWITLGDARYAFSINERSNVSAWQPIIWPLRWCIPIACALLLIQGVSEVMKSVHAWRTGRQLVHHEKIDV